MAAIQRSLAELSALLADNSVGAIDPQDIRDLVESLRPGHGVIYLSAQDGTSDITDTVTWKPLTGTWSLKAGASRFSMPVSGRLRYDGTVARTCFVAATAEIDNASGQENGQVALALNGTVVDSTITNQTMGVAWHETVIVNGVLALDPGDYVTIMVRNLTAAHDINTDYAHLLAMDFPA